MSEVISILLSPYFDLIDRLLDAPPVALATVSAAGVVVLAVLVNG